MLESEGTLSELYPLEESQESLYSFKIEELYYRSFRR